MLHDEMRYIYKNVIFKYHYYREKSLISTSFFFLSFFLSFLSEAKDTHGMLRCFVSHDCIGLHLSRSVGMVAIVTTLSTWKRHE